MALATTVPRTTHALARPFVTSETGNLRRVLVHSATVPDHGDCALMGGPGSFGQDAVDDIVAQHADLARQLDSRGTRVLRLEDVLDSAIAAARHEGALASWLHGNYPGLTDRDEVRAALLLGRDSRGCPLQAAQGPQPLHGLGYLRDFALMIPGGLVLGNVAAADRHRQQQLFRFTIRHAPELRRYPVLFDARSFGLSAECGDCHVLDERTLLLGVGNYTDPRIAAPLARHTGMDVVAVNIANADTARWRLQDDAMRDLFLHLNTSVAHVAPGHVLALPWWFEAEYTSHAALKRPDPLVVSFGRVARYRGWSGDRDQQVEGFKLVDYLRMRGIRLSFVGDVARDELESSLAATARNRVIFPARERQATNLLATAAGSLLAFRGSGRTHAALRADGVEVRTVAGQELWRGYGGPHCLALPLERV
jgi:arginine deiminase